MLQLLGEHAVDYPRRYYLYEYPEDTPPHQLNKKILYGKGFSYSRVLPEDPRVNRKDIEQRIINQEFDLVIFAVTRKPMLIYRDLVMQHYPPSRVAFVDGHDWLGWSGVVGKRDMFWGKAIYLMRELPDGCPPTRPESEDYPLIKRLREQKDRQEKEQKPQPLPVAPRGSNGEEPELGSASMLSR